MGRINHIKNTGGYLVEEIIKELRSEFNKRKDNLQEDNIRIHIIANTFLECYGYDTKKCIYEAPTGKGYCDMLVPTIGDKALAIEVKTGKRALKIKDIDQVKRYADDKQQRFAILSNGYEYVLLDFNIKSAPIIDGDALKSYVVFWFNIFMARGQELTELKYFKYLSFENLYKRQSALFYCDVAQYREWKLEQGMKQVSWRVYQSTLYSFYDYYSQKVLYQKPFEPEGKRAYETLGMDSIKGFIKERKRGAENISKDTVNNNHTHIYNMLYELKKHGRIGYICLDDSRKQNLVEYEETEQKKNYDTIKTEDIQEVINFLKQGRNSTRDIVLFLLTVTLGLERSQLLELTWNNFDSNFKHIIVDGRKIELCLILQRYLARLYKEKRQNRVKIPHVLQIYYNKQYKPMREWNINDIFDNFAKITNDEKWKNYSPKYVRSCLIKTLFATGYSLEDIIYITGIDIKNLANLIDTDEILERKSEKVNWKQLYNGILCEKA